MVIRFNWIPQALEFVGKKAERPGEVPRAIGYFLEETGGFKPVVTKEGVIAYHPEHGVMGSIKGKTPDGKTTWFRDVSDPVDIRKNWIVKKDDTRRTMQPCITVDCKNDTVSLSAGRGPLRPGGGPSWQKLMEQHDVPIERGGFMNTFSTPPISIKGFDKPVKQRVRVLLAAPYDPEANVSASRHRTFRLERPPKGQSEK